MTNLTPSRTRPAYPDADGMRDFWEAYDTNYDAMNQLILKKVEGIPALAFVVSRLNKSEMDESSRISRELLRAAALDGAWEPLHAHHREQGIAYAAMGVPFGDWFELVSAYQEALVPLLMGMHPNDVPRLTRLLVTLNGYLNLAMSTVGDAYLEAKQRIIKEQQHAIQELSTPVLRLSDRLLLLPLVGILDTQRARLMTEQLLHAVRQHRAKVVVMDITGVPAVDSKVAQHLLQTVAAARLMGALSIITGLSAEVAQALVVLGVDTERLNTVGDLQGGLEAAHLKMGMRLVPVDAGALPSVSVT